MLWLCLTLQIKLGGGLAPLLPGSDAYAMHWSLIVIVQLEDYNFKTAFLKFPFFKTTGIESLFRFVTTKSATRTRKSQGAGAIVKLFLAREFLPLVSFS